MCKDDQVNMRKLEIVETNDASAKESFEFKQEKQVPVIAQANRDSPAGAKPKKEEIAPFFGRARNLHIACILNVETTNLFPQSFNKSMQNFNVSGLEQLGTDGGTPEDDFVPPKGLFPDFVIKILIKKKK